MLASSTSPVRIGPISLPRWGLAAGGVERVASASGRQAELGGAVASDDLGIPGNLLLTSSPLGATRTMQPVQAPAANRLADVGRPPDRPSARGAGRAAGGLITDGDTQWMTVGAELSFCKNRRR
jgi:hypothetical protein